VPIQFRPYQSQSSKTIKSGALQIEDRRAKRIGEELFGSTKEQLDAAALASS
jgi:hypothetical protein